MDSDTFSKLNGMLGNQRNAAMLEWAIGKGSLQFEQRTTVVLGGAIAEGDIAGRRIVPWRVTVVPAGSELQVRSIADGRFLYVAVAGGIDVPVVLGSRSTCLPGGFGGFEGRLLRTGDRLAIGTSGNHPAIGMARNMSRHEELDGRISGVAAEGDRRSNERSLVVRVIAGPQARLFSDDDWQTFLTTDYRVSLRSDRMGYRLDGPALTSRTPVDLPSEPTCVGAIQVPAGAPPIVLMNDGPTLGGYPKIAVVTRDDLSSFAQRTPNDRVRFTLIR